MALFKIALLQMISSGSDQDANLAKREIFCRRAAGMGANVALFPEMWNIGAEFDMDNIRSYRKRETWGNAYRRPKAYDALISTDVDEPFVRLDLRR